MLGFNDAPAEAPPVAEPPMESEEPVEPEPPPAPPTRQGAVGIEPLGAGTGTTRSDVPEPLDAFDALAASIDQAVERVKRESRPAPRREPPKRPAERSPRPAERSPRPAERSPKPVERSVRPVERSEEPVEESPRPAETPVAEDRHMVSYVARAFISMAADLEELGVPEGHRTRVRLALLDLAHHLDCGSVTWGIIRDAVTLVMHYPALGRQAMPLLLPYLESAA
jgi:hypothetical protein